MNTKIYPKASVSKPVNRRKVDKDWVIREGGDNMFGIDKIGEGVIAEWYPDTDIWYFGWI